MLIDRCILENEFLEHEHVRELTDLILKEEHDAVTEYINSKDVQKTTIMRAAWPIYEALMQYYGKNPDKVHAAAKIAGKYLDDQHYYKAKRKLLDGIKRRITDKMAKGEYEAVESLKIKYKIKGEEIDRLAVNTAMELVGFAGSDVEDYNKSVKICRWFLGKKRAKMQAVCIFRRFAEFEHGHAKFYERALDFYEMNREYLNGAKTELNSVVMRLMHIYFTETRFKLKSDKRSVYKLSERYKVGRRKVKKAGEEAIHELIARREEIDGKKRCVEKALQRAYNIALYIKNYS